MSLPSLLYALLFSVLFTAQTWGDSHTVHDLKQAFSKNLMSRNQYLDQLATLRFEIMMRPEKATPAEDSEIAAIDDVMWNNPTTSSHDNKVLCQLRVGEWESPRHNYLYRSDGSWTMLPIISNVTRGRWKIEGSIYYDWIPGYASNKIQYKIILLDKHYFISSMGNHLFYERRLK